MAREEAEHSLTEAELQLLTTTCKAVTWATGGSRST